MESILPPVGHDCRNDSRPLETEPWNMPMTPEEIQKELDRLGITHAALGRRARPKTLSSSTIWKNVNQIRGAKSARARRLIAKAIGRTEEEVFGVQHGHGHAA